MNEITKEVIGFLTALKVRDTEGAYVWTLRIMAIGHGYEKLLTMAYSTEQHRVMAREFVAMHGYGELPPKAQEELLSDNYSIIRYAAQGSVLKLMLSGGINSSLNFLNFTNLSKNV